MLICNELDKFKEGFLWGSASATYQVEGVYDEEGKDLNIGEKFLEVPGTTYKSTEEKIIVDHYKQFKEDVILMKEMGLKAYRVSISWSRIYPKGRGKINEKGLEFYDKLIDELIANDIKPIITIYHWDLPQYLQDLYGGWESREIIDDFNNYCITLYKRYGEKVKYWITLNEQNVFMLLGYKIGTYPPRVKDEKRMLKANHIASLANAKAIVSFREYVTNGMIGPSFAFTPNYAYTCKPEDELARENAEDINCHWWLDIYCFGNYPTFALNFYEKQGVAPEIEDGDLEILEEGKPDFIGINYYRSETVEGNIINKISNFNEVNVSDKKGAYKEYGIQGSFKTIKNPNLERTNWDCEIDPTGLRIGIRRINSRYRLPILVTENGLGEFDKLEAGDVINDDYRIDFIRNHILACKEAITDGVELLGYCTWSFTDLLSCVNGYQKRYGFVYVNRDENHVKDLKRIKKKSFYWYKNVIRTNGEEL